MVDLYLLQIWKALSIFLQIRVLADPSIDTSSFLTVEASIFIFPSGCVIFLLFQAQDGMRREQSEMLLSNNGNIEIFIGILVKGGNRII